MVRIQPTANVSAFGMHSLELLDAVSLSLLSQFVDLQGHTLLWLQIYTIAGFVSLWFWDHVITRTPLTAKPPASRVTDMYFWLMMPAARTVSRAVVAVFLVVAAITLGHELTPKLFEGFGPVSRQPRWLLAIEVLMLMDMSSYWTHRLFHTVPFLWRFHAVHHSATTISWSTTGRLHPINDILNYSLGIIPAFLLGFPIGMVLAMAPILSWYAVAAHANWNPEYGPLRTVFASPRFHRWHHTLSHEGGNKNFSNVFSLWDRMFGSYYLPEDRAPEVFGLDDGKMPEQFLAQLAAPFRSDPLQPNVPEQPEVIERPRARPLRNAS
jgi:sterol desaturase/sphingolipid hydroxylase (fatty acid hydroxylase superfamily)